MRKVYNRSIPGCMPISSPPYQSPSNIACLQVTQRGVFQALVKLFHTSMPVSNTAAANGWVCSNDVIRTLQIASAENSEIEITNNGRSIVELVSYATV